MSVAQSSQPKAALFSCRIVSIDSYCAPPIKDLDVCYSNFRGRAVEKVPVVRVFGATPLGQKCCVHVHGAFPYLYVPCPPRVASPDERYLQHVAASIDMALLVSMGSSSSSSSTKPSTSNAPKPPSHHVFKITLVRGMYVRAI